MPGILESPSWSRRRRRSKAQSFRSELLRAQPEARNVGEQVERALRQDARNARDPRKPLVEQAPAPVEGGKHLAERNPCLRRFLERGQRAVLRKRRGIRGHLALELRGGLCD